MVSLVLRLAQGVLRRQALLAPGQDVVRRAVEDSVDSEHAVAREREFDGQPVGEQHQHEGEHQQHGEHEQRLAWRHASAGERASGRARHLRIELAVGIVVDRAARCAHREHAQGEDDQQLPRREIAGGQPQRPPGRPQQQQRTDRPVHPGQHQIVQRLLALAWWQLLQQPVQHARGARRAVRRLRLGFGDRPRRARSGSGVERGGLAGFAFARSRGHRPSLAWARSAQRVPGHWTDGARQRTRR